MPLALVLYQLKDVGKGLFRFDVDRQRLQFAETLVRPIALFQVQVYVQAVNVFVILPGKIKSHFEKTLPHGNPAHGLLLIYELAEPRLPVIVESPFQRHGGKRCGNLIHELIPNGLALVKLPKQDFIIGIFTFVIEKGFVHKEPRGYAARAADRKQRLLSLPIFFVIKREDFIFGQREAVDSNIVDNSIEVVMAVHPFRLEVPYGPEFLGVERGLEPGRDRFRP